MATWLHRIAVNAALMKLRAKQSRIQEGVLDSCPEFTPQGAFAQPQTRWCELPEDAVLREEMRGQVLEAIAALPMKYRQALLLRDIEGASNQHLSRELGISVNAAKIRVHRARQALRTLLEPMCLV